MTTLQLALTVFSLIVQFGTVCTLIYAFAKFLAKPHDTLEQRVTVLEVKQQEIEREKNRLDDRCKEQDETNEVLTRSTLALIEFEIQYCLTEKKPMSKDLEKARDDLHHYLAKR